MNQLNNFISYLTGTFNNQNQVTTLKKQGIDFVNARHVNTVVNDKIANLPIGFKGIFMIEESYYTQNNHETSSCHLFLFNEEDNAITLLSYELDKNFNVSLLKEEGYIFDYDRLVLSNRFTKTYFYLENNCYHGKSVSQFNENVTFKLEEKFSKDLLEVKEELWVKGKLALGFDYPIIYERN